jgi:RND family efflux transporter MFP subunit
MSLIGQIRAQHEVRLAFRIDGKLIERPVNVGDQIKTGQLIARIDSENEQNALRAAEADISAAQAALTQAQRVEARQRELIARGFTTAVQFDQAVQQLRTAEAQLESAHARHRTAQDRVRYAELRADVTGIVTAKAAEPGEVVRAGQMIVQVARDGLKDAVFDVPTRLVLLQGLPQDPIIQIALVENPNIKATGRMREMAPQADAATRMYPVKIGLVNPPEQMRLGSTVTGGIVLQSPPVISIPGTALIEINGKPSVWVVDSTTSTVSLRPIEIVQYAPTTVIVANGLKDGELVVTAGIHVLVPGQKVKVVDQSS